MQRRLCGRVRDVRVQLGLTQKTLASRAGVTLPTLRRFEQTGEVSLKHMMRIVYALGRIDEFDTILKPPRATSIAELEARDNRPVRKRGTR